ncbi:RmuC domain-containing protein [Perkinsela sp. CCAP 1560/4]|nr:RmuC domain-containing protein [Perkinsela sp. CCAP 1560/4]|eukprot:KNH06280.1 RmuC domain-containing protein [Perkinsela sp. CCAP 1560/4]
MIDLRALPVEGIADWVRDTYNVEHDPSDSKKIPYDELITICTALRKFPWDLLLDLSPPQSKQLLKNLLFLLIRLFSTRKDIFLLSFDAIFSSLKNTLGFNEGAGWDSKQWFSLISSFTSDLIIGAILCKTGCAEDELLSYLLNLQYSSHGRSTIGTKFILEVLFHSLNFYSTESREGCVSQTIRRVEVKSVVAARGVGKPSSNSDTNIQQTEDFPALTASESELQKLFARTFWNFFIELENYADASDQAKPERCQLLDEVSCTITKTALVAANSSVRTCLFNELKKFLILISGSTSSRKFLAIQYLFFVLSRDATESSEILREEISRAVHSRLYSQATNAILFHASYCVRAPRLLDSQLFQQERVFVQKIFDDECCAKSPEGSYDLFRHAVAQSIMYLTYVEESRHGRSTVQFDEKAFAAIDLACITPSVLTRFRKVHNTASKTSDYAFPGKAEDALETVCWFPFDPCDLANLWELIQNSGYNYVL